MALVVSCSEPTPPSDTGVAVVKWRNTGVRGETVPVLGETAVYHLEQETHVLAAVRRSDGATMWRRTLPVTNPNFDGYGLALVGGVLVVGDLDLFGVDPATGDILWKYEQSTGRNPGFNALTVADGIVYCASTSGHVFAVDPVTGTERWASAPRPTTSSTYGPRVLDGVVYVGFTDFAQGSPTRGGAAAVDASTGAVIWSVLLPAPSTATPTDNTHGVVVFGQRVFVGSVTGVHILDRETGAFVSTLGPEFFGSSGLTPWRPFAVGGLLLVNGGGQPKVIGIDPATLRIKWQVPTNSTVISLNGDHEVAYIPHFAEFTAVRLSTGVPKWTFKPRGVGDSYESYLAAPAFDDSLVYLPGSKSVYAFRR